MLDISDASRWIVLIQVGATLTMVGLIWFVQLVHYPLMAHVGREHFLKYETEHQRLTTLLVVPLMLSELLSALLLLWCRPEAVDSGLVWTGLLLVIFIWLVTFAVQVPQHERLTISFEAPVHRRLVRGNWLRTAAWTARGLIVLAMLSQLLRPVLD
ncbi:hypothetical protein [Roseimaritima ulvae]|uniref:DUF1772 domain-containing protein n=1 Tax=Roseimaritima ulvae TaxID=980254 RepID=A0A5B9QTE1_9BACT|nr:hypothetical protein [Roseimaritima ulvae]QEG41182.1 hypothetical protein UC8_32010 [Roseimaritima ulvae]